MFTGIISHKGTFQAYTMSRREMTLTAPGSLAEGLELGGSLAVDGVCLSLLKKKGNKLSFNLSAETLERTTLGGLKHGSILNLERPLTLSSPLDGHIVSGHIDGRERLIRLTRRAEGVRLAFTVAAALRPFLIPKGSIAVNGVSLTVAGLSSSMFEVEIIPLTFKATNLGLLKLGDAVNIESDILGKYMYNWVFKDSPLPDTKDIHGKNT